MSGRPRKPNHIKEALGTLREGREIENYVRHEIIHSASAIRDLKILDEKILNADGRKYFNFICGKMIQEGILSDVYIVDIHNAAYNHQTITECQRNLTEDGYVVTFPSGAKQISPYVAIKEKAEKALNEFSNRYGLNLASSQKIQIPDNSIDEFDHA